MEKEKMTVHEGMAELKLLNKRIEKAVSELNCCVANRASNKKIGGIDIEQWKKNEKSKYQSILDMIDRAGRIKRAIVLSNAVTTVTVAGKEYTVAEAIWIKTSGLDNKERLRYRMMAQFDNAANECDLKNRGLEERAENHIVNMYGGNSKDVNVEDSKKQREEFVKNNTYEIQEVVDCKAEIEKIEKEIYDFQAAVDSALSISNAVTMIEF